MSKPFLIVTFLHPVARSLGVCVAWVICGVFLVAPAVGQDSDEKTEQADTAATENEPTNPVYPLAVAVDGDVVYTVDKDLPGVWKTSPDGRELFVRGSNLLRQPLNVPRPIALHPEGGILVGDSPTREIYWIASPDAELKPLNDGYLGIPMALVVDPAGETLYVGLADRVPGPHGVGLHVGGEARLRGDRAVVRIDVDTKEVEPIVTGRPFQYVNGLAWAGGHAYVTDIYGKTIWKVTPDGKTEKWHEGEPLVGPVGITATESSIFVADPKQKQVYEFDLETKEITPRL